MGHAGVGGKKRRRPTGRRCRLLLQRRVARLCVLDLLLERLPFRSRLVTGLNCCSGLFLRGGNSRSCFGYLVLKLLPVSAQTRLFSAQLVDVVLQLRESAFQCYACVSLLLQFRMRMFQFGPCVLESDCGQHQITRTERPPEEQRDERDRTPPARTWR